jgi:hypothetical protein
MAKKKNTIPSGFEDVLGNIYSNAEEGESISNIDDILPPDTPLEDEEDKNVPPVNTEDGKDNKDDTQASAANEDDSDIPEDVLKQNTETTVVDNEEHEDNEEPSDADLIEAQQVGLLFDAVGQSLGWNMNDIKEEDRPLTVDALTEYLSRVVKENSVPEYADERIQRLDEYVKNGGKFEDFYSK